MYPKDIDAFTEKLNKKDSGVYVIEEIVDVVDGKYEAMLKHDNINNETIKVYTGTRLSGEEIKNVIVSSIDETPWRRMIKVFTHVSPVYITYETTGDQVEADDINQLQDSVTATQEEIERYKGINDSDVKKLDYRVEKVESNKAEKTHVDSELLKKADKVNTYTKQETDKRIQLVINAAPDALDTLKEIADALNNDPDFAATITGELAGKVDKVPGKQLSTEDYSTKDKIKLSNIEANANKYVHPVSHQASNIVQDSSHRFVKDSDKSNWNAKETPTGAQGKADKAERNAKEYTDEHIADEVKHITANERIDWNDAYSKKHKHENKSIIDSITQALVNKWNEAYSHISNSVKHITSTERSSWNTVTNKVNKETGKGLSSNDYTTEEKNKLKGIEINANKYIHPTNHPPSIINQDSNNRFVSDSEKSKWNAKSNLCLGETSSTAYRGDRGKIAYEHSKISHAPSNAQKNSDITKSEIEAKLKGNITSHSHNPDHTHSNKSVLDKISMSGSESSFDLSQFVTDDELGDVGYGDMLKSIYDKNNNGKVDKAEKADSVAWTGISGKPSTYPPSTHNHNSSYMPKGAITWNQLKGVY